MQNYKPSVRVRAAGINEGRGTIMIVNNIKSA